MTLWRIRVIETHADGPTKTYFWSPRRSASTGGFYFDEVQANRGLSAARAQIKTHWHYKHALDSGVTYDLSLVKYEAKEVA